MLYETTFYLHHHLYALGFKFKSSNQLRLWRIWESCYCDFEQDCPYLNFVPGKVSIWQIATPDKPFFGYAPDESNALLTDSVEPYPINTNSYAELAFPINNEFNFLLSFKHKFQTDTLLDGGYVEVSYDNEDNWVNVIEDPSLHFMHELNFQNMYDANDSLIDGKFGFSGNSGDWITTKIQWIWVYPIREIPPQWLRLRFHFISDNLSEELDGWMIDDIFLSVIDLGSGLDELQGQFKTNISPNPFTEKTKLNFPNPNKETFALYLYDLNGKRVFSEEAIRQSTYELSKNTLDAGIYFFRLTGPDGQHSSGKLVIE